MRSRLRGTDRGLSPLIASLIACLGVGCQSARRSPESQSPQVQGYSQSASRPIGSASYSIASEPEPAISEEPIPGRSLTLAWDPNPEPDVTGYRVYVGGEMVADAEDTTATLSDLAWSDSHSLTVTAHNEAGLESPPSETLVVPPPPLDLSGPLRGEDAGKLKATGWPGAELSVMRSTNLTDWSEDRRLTLDREGQRHLTVTSEGERQFWRIQSATNRANRPPGALSPNSP